MKLHRMCTALCLAAAGLAVGSANAEPLNDKTEVAAPERLQPVVLDNRALLQEALAAYDLADAQLVRLDVPAQANGPFETAIPIDGHNEVIQFNLHSNRAPGYQVRVEVAPGEWEVHEPGAINTYRGTIDAIPGATAAASITPDEGFAAVIRYPDDGGTRWVERIDHRILHAPANTYIVYKGEDAMRDKGFCGVDFIENPEAEDGVGVRGGGCGGGICVAQLGCDADFEFYQGRGSSVTNVENRINSVINFVNNQYESEVEITHEITAILVRTTSGAPYTSSSPGTLLTQFRNEWNNNQGGIPRDVGQLFSGKDFGGPGDSTIGLASVGVICTSSGYNIVQSDCCGSLSCSADLSAHELGHNWSALHCSCPGNTMNSGLTCANDFTAASINSITNHRDSRGCLDPIETGMTSLPFFDDIPNASVDPTLWIGNDGVSAGTGGLNEPSAPNALRLNGPDQIRSALMDTTGATTVTVSYYWQRTGGGNSPEPGDDLYVEYLTSTGLWANINVHLGDGPDMTTFQFEEVVLPSNAIHTGFRLRFRHTSDQPFFDDFWVDDIGVVAEQNPPGAFQLLTPTDGETDVDLGPLFDWTDAGGAANYKLIVDDNSDFSSPELQLFVLGSIANIGGSPLDNATLYYWTVEANNANGTTNPDVPVFTFSTPGYVPPTACPGDATGDNMVNFDDLNAVLGNWGTAGPTGDVFPTGAPDGIVDFDDLNAVLGSWNQSCP